MFSACLFENLDQAENRKLFSVAKLLTPKVTTVPPHLHFAMWLAKVILGKTDASELAWKVAVTHGLKHGSERETLPQGHVTSPDGTVCLECTHVDVPR